MAFLSCLSPRSKNPIDSTVSVKKAHNTTSKTHTANNLTHAALPSLGKLTRPNELPGGVVISNFPFGAIAAQPASAIGRPRTMVMATHGTRNSRSVHQVATYGR
jgi:hypothetical protein